MTAVTISAAVAATSVTDARARAALRGRAGDSMVMSP
jgi:hypothetical protein